jgi:hypothetical protein
MKDEYGCDLSENDYLRDINRYNKPQTCFVQYIYEECKNDKYFKKNVSETRYRCHEAFINGGFINQTTIQELASDLNREIHNKFIEKDLWLSIHGNINNNFKCTWGSSVEIQKIIRIELIKVKNRQLNKISDINFRCTCENGVHFQIKLRWGHGIFVQNVRIGVMCGEFKNPDVISTFNIEY